MTIDLDAIKARANAASAGPWKLVTDFCDCGGDFNCSHGESPYALRLPTHVVRDADRPCTPGDSLDVCRHNASDFGDLTMADAEFLAHARQDIPELIAEVQRLREALEAADEGYIDLDTRLDQVRQERDALRAEANR